MKSDDDKNKLTPISLTSSVEYLSNSIISKSIILKRTGTVQLFAFDTGQEFTERTLPFDWFVQILEGSATVTVDSRAMSVGATQAIIIPAFSRNAIKAEGRFKMLATVIKSGYENESDGQE